jgi:Cd2+/Zn2+-exporting ATPase
MVGMETTASSSNGPAGGAGAAVFSIPGMDCAVEEAEIRRALAGVAGVRGLRFELATRRLRIDAPTAAIPQALEAIRGAGFEVRPLQADASAHPGSGAVSALPWRAGLALVLALAAELLDFVALPATLPGVAGLAFAEVAGMALAAVAIVLAGFSTYRKGLAALRRGRLNISALMAVAVTGAFLIGEWPEAAMVMALYAIAELIEARAVDRARHAIARLLDLAPDTAELRCCGDHWQLVPAAEVPLDAIVRVKPGARIPLDGVVTAGASAVDQASVTGESIPVDKGVGDAVYAGTVNTTGMLELRVSAVAGDSTLARIIHAVEQAQAARAPTQQFVDRFAAVYTPLVFVFALAVALLAPWLLDWAWTEALYRALVLLVIACPCALVIATPVTVVSGLAAAARRGVLIKGGVHLEGAGALKAVAFDKTGTITEGRPRLVATELLVDGEDARHALRWAVDLARHSDHPVARAVAQGGEPGNGTLDGFTVLPGRGVQARSDGRTLVLGNHRLIEERGLCNAAIEARLAGHEAQGRTVTLLADAGRVLAVFAVADTIRARAREALAGLHELGVASVMLSGDNAATVRTIASDAGIDDARGNLLPADKLAAIAALRERYGPVAMAGDGINDAPALARADIGIAMGAAGTDIAMEAADIVIMNDDLRRIPDTIRLSRRVQAVLRQNIVLALGIKAAFLALALAGSATMWMAVFADMGASLLVVFNGLRLLRANGMTRAGEHP